MFVVHRNIDSAVTLMRAQSKYLDGPNADLFPAFTTDETTLRFYAGARTSGNAESDAIAYLLRSDPASRLK